MKKEEEERKVQIRTIVKQENNSEIFMTDAPDVDFDKLNEDNTKALRDKFEVADMEQQSQNNVLTTHVEPADAFKKFRDMQLQEYIKGALDLEEVQGGSILVSQRRQLEQLELPSAKLERLQKELEELE